LVWVEGGQDANAQEARGMVVTIGKYKRRRGAGTDRFKRFLTACRAANGEVVDTNVAHRFDARR
jgi:hypothetical protein